MTIAELGRSIASYQRRQKQQAQERAAYDYILAGLTARNIASMFSEDATIPALEEVYSGLFEDKAQTKIEEKQKLKAELSVLRFKEFANYHNRKFDSVGGGNLKNE